MHVVETIRVRAEGNRIRRGIYRDVSTTFEDAERRVHRVGFDLLSLTRDGRPEPYHTSATAITCASIAGDEDIFLDTGAYTYVLTYETDRQIRWFDDKPELFWNVTGNDWDFPIAEGERPLHAAGRRSAGRMDRLHRPRGRARDGFPRRGRRRGPDRRDVAQARSRRGTERRRGDSGGRGRQAGTAADNFRYFLRDHREWFIGIAGLLVVLAYYLWAWNRVGRDPKGGTIIPLFHPPKDISAALASYIRNWGFGANAWKAFTASALALAVRGLLVFDQEGKDLVLERTDGVRRRRARSLPAGEKTVLDWVEKQGGKADDQQGQRQGGRQDRREVQDERQGGERRALFQEQHPRTSPSAFVLSLLTVGAIVVFGELSQDDLGMLFAMFFVGIFLSVFLVPIIASLFDGRGGGADPRRRSLLVLAVVIGLFHLFRRALRCSDMAGGMRLDAVVAARQRVRDHAFPFALMLVFPLLNGVFYYLLRAPTAEGRPVMDQIEGFRMYLETAESGRLNIADAPEITTERFEALLPYAVALGVERPWADAFASALARAHPNDPDPMSHYHPRWRRGGDWSSGSFGRSIASAVASATSARRVRSRGAPPVRPAFPAARAAAEEGAAAGGGRHRKAARPVARSLRRTVMLRPNTFDLDDPRRCVRHSWIPGALARHARERIDAVPRGRWAGLQSPRAFDRTSAREVAMPDLLLELFSEEIPARMQRQAAEDLRRLVTDALVEAGLTYEGAKAFVTPRRLALTVHGLTARSADVTEEKKGPRVGAPEKAIEGFLRGAGLASIDAGDRSSPTRRRAISTSRG